MNGHLYRVCPATEDRIRELVRDYVGESGWSFGGAAAWDFEPERGHKNLRALAKFDDATTLDCTGDFGHAFSLRAEVRWKRRDDGSYDVLVLSEQQLTIAGATSLPGTWDARPSDKLGIVQTGEEPPIGYIGYYARNGAQTFTRYTKPKERS